MSQCCMLICSLLRMQPRTSASRHCVMRFCVLVLSKIKRKSTVCLQYVALFIYFFYFVVFKRSILSQLGLSIFLKKRESYLL